MQAQLDDINAAVHEPANQHVDAVVQVNRLNNLVMENLANRPFVDNNQYRNYFITGTEDPHRHFQQSNAPLECRCTYSSAFTIDNIPSYQLFFCCGINCHRYRTVITCLRLDQIEAIYKLIHSDSFQFNPDFYTNDSVDPDR